MSVSELKLKIFREIDSLEKNSLVELHRILLNFIISAVDQSHRSRTVWGSSRSGEYGCQSADLLPEWWNDPRLFPETWAHIRSCHAKYIRSVGKMMDVEM